MNIYLCDSLIQPLPDLSFLPSIITYLSSAASALINAMRPCTKSVPNGMPFFPFLSDYSYVWGMLFAVACCVPGTSHLKKWLGIGYRFKHT